MDRSAMDLSAVDFPTGCVPACPGCRYRSLPAAESDQRKHAWASASLAPLPVAPILAPAMRWGYRRKALLHAAVESGAWRFGLLRRFGHQRRETELIPIPSCPLHSGAMNERFMVLRTLIPLDAPLVFAQISGSVLTLVLKCAPAEKWRHMARALESPLRAAGLSALFLNWNPAAGRRAMSSRHQELVFGPLLSRGEDGLLHGALSFRQQIPELEGAALGRAGAHLAGAARVVDLYSGAGASLAEWLRARMSVVGVELGGEACRAAEQNAPGATILKGRVEHRLPQLTEWVKGAPFSLYTNPPRDGHALEVNEWILLRRPEKIAYLSCNPRALARDLAALSAAYEVIAPVQPLDFFPQTDHVECLALLSLRRLPVAL